MTVSEKTINWILVVLLMVIMAVFFSSDAKADKKHHEKHDEHAMPVKGDKGDPGINGADGAMGFRGYTGRTGLGVNGSDGINGLSYSNNVFNRAISITGAMNAIPSPSHTHKDHGHTMFGAGVGGYNGENGVAVGITHMQDDVSGKATLGVSGGETIYGVGAGWTF